ncbi:MAG: zf-HC2 domain-containing protein [Acidimicrobiia bacterium]
MKPTTIDTTTATDEALASAATKGHEAAFDELHRRHAPLAWRLALAITSDPELAAGAVAAGTGTVFTALRAGRFQAQPHGTALAAATRNAALDLRIGVVTATPVVADDADAHLAAAFAALPERWRSVLWLRDAEGLDAAQVAPVVELTPEAVDQLAVRARRGLRERYLRTEVGAAGPRACTRAVARLGALEDGTLDARDVATLERHLGTCAACAERRDRLAALGGALPTLALPVPTDLRARAGKAWTSALATSTHTGLSPRTEKILAGASAFAAVAGIVGAAFFGRGGDAEPVASPLAPLVADIEAPRPVDLSELTLPLTTPDAITSSARRSLSPVARSTAAPGAVSGSPSSEAPAAPGSGAPAPIASEDPASDVPVGVDPDDGVTVGPVNLDPSPGEDDPALDVDTSGPLAPLEPIVEPVEDAANQVLEPAAEASEPVTTPVLEATEPVTAPVTDAITDAADSLL